MSTAELVVVALDDRIPGVRSLRLARRDGGPLPSFTPGSHLVVECGPVLNAYSLTGDGVAPTGYEVSVLERPDGSGGSGWIHQLDVGDTVATRPPRSAFAPVLRATRHLLVAAGIGITPMVSHLRSARRWGRDAELLYVHRPGRGAHVQDVERLTAAVSIFTDRAAFTSALAGALARQPLGTHLYLCGPAAFMDDVTAMATDLGWPPSRVHVEHFGTAAFDPGEPFEVHLTISGDRFTVDAGVSLLAALQARGHAVPHLCRRGVCGECRIAVTGGEILHRDLYLSEAERDIGDSMMCCVSRAAGDRLELAL
ncbi:PDR/VanB family oxidoreductase [Mycobacterium antarcticum]|uniref:PDR/VanB family oxidoreductase n=1 Tax=Mycolicibacterium sp. TUM20984 TaxID=3023368 RepID=UPI00239A9B1F|nr:PDR/VanB family oxidoreductase [Mycolicibacterium sp. TUM20984]GLP80488.1 ferredoxin [Mycolicibacterium sp. TUM20984]